MTPLATTVAIVGLAAMTVLMRALFLFSKREPTLPPWLQRGLRHAPLAALAAVVAPEIVAPNALFAGGWHDPRPYAVLAAVAYYVWRRGMLGTIVSGMAVLLALRLGLGW